MYGTPCRTNLLVLSLLLISSVVFSQKTRLIQEAGINLGSAIYQGDLTPEFAGAFKTPGWTVGLDAAHVFRSSLMGRVNLSAIGLRGSDAVYDNPEWRQQRNLRFTNLLIELNAEMMYNPLNNFDNNRKGVIAPYVFAGVGVAMTNTSRDASGFNAEYFSNEPQTLAGLTTDLNTPAARAVPVIPVGAGLRYNLTPRLVLHADYRYRLTASDYLDGFSQVANPKRADRYHTGTVGILYRFGIGNFLDCPKDPNKGNPLAY